MVRIEEFTEGSGLPKGVVVKVVLVVVEMGEKVVMEMGFGG